MVSAYLLRSTRRAYVGWQAGFLASHGPSPLAHLPTMRATLRRQPQGQVLQGLGSISLYGLRPTHLPREPAGYRDLPGGRKPRSSITWGSAVASHATPWPTPIRPGTGASTPISLSVSFHTARQAPRTSTFWTCFCPSPKPSTSWIAPISTLPVSIACIRLAASSFCKLKPTPDFRRLYSHAVDRSSGLICDQTIRLTGVHSATHYPEKLRRIKYHDAAHNRTLVFLTNQATLPPLTIAQLYLSRWQIELFFRWIKQHWRIKAFYGTSENAVKSQTWIAVSVYVLITIIKKRLSLESNLYTILQILSLTVFEKTPLDQPLRRELHSFHRQGQPKQLTLFD